jgi:hypothetical protein
MGDFGKPGGLDGPGFEVIQAEFFNLERAT